MIWFFLAGFISGAVGTVMFAGWWIHTHATVVRMDETNNESEEHSDD